MDYQQRKDDEDKVEKRKLSVSEILKNIEEKSSQRSVDFRQMPSNPAVRRRLQNRFTATEWRHDQRSFESFSQVPTLIKSKSFVELGETEKPNKKMSISDRIAQIKENSETWKQRGQWRNLVEDEVVGTPLKSVNAIATTLKGTQEDWRKKVQGGDVEKFSRTPKLGQDNEQVVMRKGLSKQTVRCHTFNEFSTDQPAYGDGGLMVVESGEDSEPIEPRRLPMTAIIRQSYFLDTKLFAPTPQSKNIVSQSTPSLVFTRTVQVSKIDTDFVDQFFISKSIVDEMSRNDNDVQAMTDSTTPIKLQSLANVEFPETNLGPPDESLTAFKRPTGPSKRPSKLSQNPIRAINKLPDVQDKYEEVRVRVPGQEDPLGKRTFTPCGRITGSGSVGFVATSATQVDENAHLSESALAGLASIHDFSSSKNRLRQVAEENQAPLAPFQRSLLPNKETTMLLHIKGRRQVQTRLVKPVAASLNSGDCFLLLCSSRDENAYRTPIVWIGRFANVVEVNKARDLAAWIVKTKDLGFKGESSSTHPDGYAVIEEGKEYQVNNSLLSAFQKALGMDSEYVYNSSGTQDEDTIFETVVQHTNRVYEVTDDRLEPYPEAWGSPLRYSILSSKKAFVFDFGSEVYLWTGNQISPKLRAAGIELVQQAYAAPYDYSTCTLNPINAMEAIECPVEGSTRPEWTLVAKVSERGETVLFKEKFIDWPEGSRYGGVKIARAQSARLSDNMETSSTSIEPYSSKLLFSEAFEQPPPPAQLLTLEGRFVGRGGEGSLPFDGILRKFRVETGAVQVWLVSEYSRTLLPEISHGQFFRGETYVIRWPFKLIYTGQREIALSGQAAANTEQCAYFFWQGSASKITQQGAAALMTIELDEEKGPQIRVVESKESPAFCNLFDGRMIIHDGCYVKDETSSVYKRTYKATDTRLFFVRGERASEAHLMEVPASTRSLRSRGLFLVVTYLSGAISKSWLWIGSNASSISVKAGKHLVERLQTAFPPELGDRKIYICHVYEKDTSESIDLRECLTSLDTIPTEVTSSLQYKSESRLVVWQLLFNLGPKLVPSRLVYPLEPDITAGAAFNITIGTYPESDSLYSPQLPVPLFPVLLSDLDSAEQPALFLVVHADVVYLWHGWWPLVEGCVTSLSSGSTSRYSSFSCSSPPETVNNILTTSSSAPRLRRNRHASSSSENHFRPFSSTLEIMTGDGGFSPSGDVVLQASPTSPANGVRKSGSAHSRFLTAHLAALRTTLALANQIGPKAKAFVVYSGIEPDPFLHLFPPTIRDDYAACYHLDNGKVIGQTDNVAEILEKLENLRFSLVELQQRPLPPELDTTHLETYLSEDEFMAAFNMSKNEFDALPAWKRCNLKRSLDLF